MTARLLDSFDQYEFVPQLYASVRSMQYLLDRASPEYQYAHVGPEVDKEKYIETVSTTIQRLAEFLTILSPMGLLVQAGVNGLHAGTAVPDC